MGPGPGKRILAAAVGWLLFITALHYWRNVRHLPASTLRVGYLPITCHLLVPVTYYHLKGTPQEFEPVKFTSWPDMIEALKGGDLDMTFILAPIAITLLRQRIPIEIVLLGHRDGTALVVRKGLHSLADLEGHPVAIPIRFSMQNLALRRLWRRAGLPLDRLDAVEMAPPDMPSALAAGGIWGYIVGEPYAAQAELAGTGRVLYQMKDAWPGFISSVVVVSKGALKRKGWKIRRLLNRFLAEARWIQAHRREAARMGARLYGLPLRLIQYVLTTPPDRVSYSDILPREEEFEGIARLMVEEGLIPAPPPPPLVNTDWLDRSLVEEAARELETEAP